MPENTWRGSPPRSSVSCRSLSEPSTRLAALTRATRRSSRAKSSIPIVAAPAAGRGNLALQVGRPIWPPGAREPPVSGRAAWGLARPGPAAFNEAGGGGGDVAELAGQGGVRARQELSEAQVDILDAGRKLCGA